MRRLLVSLVVVAVVIGGFRLAMVPIPITGYRALDDYNLALQVVGSQAQWRGATVDETASTVTIGLAEIWVHGPGFDDEIVFVALRLHDPLGSRIVVDSLTGGPVIRLDPEAPAFPPVLNIENRGGPEFVVTINGKAVANVGCNVGATPLAPGNAGVPPLPWALTVTRQRDGAVVLSATLTQLPQWLFQMGDDIGLGSTAVAGPPGPSCPPSG